MQNTFTSVNCEKKDWSNLKYCGWCEHTARRAMWTVQMKWTVQVTFTTLLIEQCWEHERHSDTDNTYDKWGKEDRNEASPWTSLISFGWLKMRQVSTSRRRRERYAKYRRRRERREPDRHMRLGIWGKQNRRGTWGICKKCVVSEKRKKKSWKMSERQGM